MERFVPFILDGDSKINKILSTTGHRDLPEGATSKRTESDAKGKNPVGPGSAARALRVLELVAAHGHTMALSEIVDALGLPKSTVHRLCSHLIDLGFLARDVDERSYAIGQSLRGLALDTLNHSSVRSLRHQVLIELVNNVGETCNFTTLDGAEVVYLDRVEAQWPLRLILDVGSHVPLHCTASGKLLLAHLPPQSFARLLPQLKLEARTPETLTCPAQLERECALIRAQGYSTDREEFIAGLVAVAAPVRDARGDVRAVVAMHAPTARMTIERAIELLPYLKDAARKMQEFL